MTLDPRPPLHKALRRLTWATLGIYLALIVVGGSLYVGAQGQRDKLERLVLSTTDALCTLRGDLERRIEDSKAFLEEHPQGIQGISAAAIQQGIDNQQKTVDALDQLECG